MESPQQNAISRISNAAKVLNSIREEVSELDVLINNPDVNWASLITDESIASVASFASTGLKAQQVFDVLAALKISIAQANNNIVSWDMLINL